jgi:H+/Cl- antiporter ClcA
VPGILVGCAFGRFAGQLIQLYISSSVRPGTYALIGAASMLGGVTRITICLTVILIEGSDDEIIFFEEFVS